MGGKHRLGVAEHLDELPRQLLQAEAKSGNLIQPNVFMLPGRIFSTAQAAIIWRGSFVEVSSVQRVIQREREIESILWHLVQEVFS